MPQTPDPQLREIIYNRVAESDDCYLFVYSGLGERLTLLSVFLEGLRDKVAGKLLIDLGLQQYIDKFNVKGTTVISSLSEITGRNSFESLFLQFIRGEIEKLTGARRSAVHVVVAIDLSSFFVKGQKSDEQGIYSLHKGIVNLTHSLKGVTAILLYDVDFLSESLMSKLVDLHGTSDHPSKRLSSPTALKDESKPTSNAENLCPTIVALSGGILFFDPPSKSGAVLLPNTEAIKDALPSDPLDAAHRDLAFDNDYTAHEGACPYSSSEVPSGCLLDPNVISAVHLRGRSFIEGRACITAIDHSLLEEKPRKNEDSNVEGDSNHYDNDKATGLTSEISNKGRVENYTYHAETSLKNHKSKGAQESVRMKRVNETLG